jgi:hypothetical protein
MAIINTLKNIQHDMYHHFPKKVPLKALQGFLLTTGVNLCIGSSYRITLVEGSVAVLATLIEAVTRPLIRRIFPENPVVAKVFQNMSSVLGATGLANAVSPWTQVTITPMMALFPIWITLFAFNKHAFEKNEAMTYII